MVVTLLTIWLVVTRFGPAMNFLIIEPSLECWITLQVYNKLIINTVLILILHSMHQCYCLLQKCMLIIEENTLIGQYS